MIRQHQPNIIPAPPARHRFEHGATSHQPEYRLKLKRLIPAGHIGNVIHNRIIPARGINLRYVYCAFPHRNNDKKRSAAMWHRQSDPSLRIDQQHWRGIGHKNGQKTIVTPAGNWQGQYESTDFARATSPLQITVRGRSPQSRPGGFTIYRLRPLAVCSVRLQISQSSRRDSADNAAAAFPGRWNEYRCASHSATYRRSASRKPDWHRPHTL